MWLSKSIAFRQRTEREGAAADMGVTTIGGGSASVMTRGEQRDLSVFSPLGMIWQPRAGDTVLVVKGGVGGQEQCIVAADAKEATPKGMSPGELYLYSNKDTFIFLRGDGSILVKGNISAEGDGTIQGNVDLTGSVTLKGTVTINGTVNINGSLIVNGQPYRPCMCG